MLLKTKSFNINEYVVPGFTLKKGEMIRFWIQIIPSLENDTDGYWAAKTMQEIIKVCQQNKMSVWICPKQIKKRVIDIINPISTGNHLISQFKLNEREVENILTQFDINPEWKVKNLGAAHQKVFSIICGFQEHQIVSFDYYGLSPNTEEQLTRFVKKEIDNGKTVLSFDNLWYKPEKPDSENIINLEIKRRKTEEDTA